MKQFLNQKKPIAYSLGLRAIVVNKFTIVILLSIISVAILLARIYAYESYGFFFMIWNLFLALIPLPLSWTFYKISQKNFKYIKSVLLGNFTVWLLFFPNAPYILTDFLHLTGRRVAPTWFDTMLLLFFAFAGLLAGIYSLEFIEKGLRKYLSVNKVSIIIAFILFLSSFGIYLGRFLRFNSWDVFFSPIVFITEVGNLIIDLPKDWSIIIFTLGFGLLLNLVYWFYRIKGE